MKIYRMLNVGIIKKSLRKFEDMALKNEINVTKAGNCILLVSPTVVWLFDAGRTDFILALSSNF